LGQIGPIVTNQRSHASPPNPKAASALTNLKCALLALPPAHNAEGVTERPRSALLNKNILGSNGPLYTMQKTHKSRQTQTAGFDARMMPTHPGSGKIDCVLWRRAGTSYIDA